MQFADINDLTVIANEIKDRANKVSGATNGNFAALDSNGDLTDSGHKHSDYLTQHQDISGKADLDENGKLVSSQKPSYTKSEVGLGNVDNTSDATKKTNFTGSIASEDTGFVTGGDAYTELAKKVDKVDGKGLSSNDYTTDEKTKLSGIAANAEVNQNAFSNVKVGSTTIASGEKTATLELEAGSNITLTPDTANKKVVLAATDTTYSDATTSVHGLMSAADKTKLDGISTGANKVESSETNGNIKIDTVETQVYDDSEIQELIDTDETETDYANPLSLETMQAQLAKNTKIKIEPIQDLHGYDKPWVGGAGKNLLPMTVEGIKGANAGTWTGNSIVMQNVTITILTDSDNNVIGIKMNGTAQNEFGFNLTPRHIANFPAGNYTYNIQENVNLNYFWVSIYAPQAIAISPKTEKSKDIIVNSGDEFGGAYIYTNAGNVFNNVIIQPMLRLSSESDATFQPYTNIASISGRSEIDILGCGKNIWDEEWENGYIYNGNYYDSNNYKRSKNFIPVHAGLTYRIINITTDGQIPCYDKNQTYKNNIPIAAGGQTYFIFTIPEGIEYIKFYNPNASFNNNVAILYPSTENTYEPYTKSNNLSIDFPSTVYGGVLDLESGELVVDRKKVDLTTLTWNGVSNNRIASQVLSDMKIYLDSQLPNSISSHYELYKSAELYGWIHEIGYALTPTGAIVVRTVDGSPQTEPIGDVVYELATPITIHLTPHQLSLLKAQNNITTSQYTQIKVVYRNGVFATLEPVSENNDGLMSRLDKVKLNSISDDATKTESSTTNGNIKINGTETQVYDDSEIKGELTTDTTTVEGNPLNFSTLSAQNAKSTILSVEPIQDLHGYDKPWVGGAGKNKLPLTMASIKASNTNGTWSGNAYTYNNVVWTILTDNDNNVVGINSNGTANENSILYLFGKIDINTNYILNGCPSGGSTTTYRQIIYPDYHDYDHVYFDTGSGTSSFTKSDASKDFECRCVIYSGVNVQNKVWFPMIRLSTETDVTFQPYTNECGISGRSEIGILGCGKNLLPMTVEGLKAENTSGTWNGNSYTIHGITFKLNIDNDGNIISISTSGTSDNSDNPFMYVAPTGTLNISDNTNIILTGCPDGGSWGTTKTYALRCVNSSWDWSVDDIGSGVTISYQSNYTRFYIEIGPNVNMSNKTFYPMICLSTETDATFEPYQESTDLTISLGQTVYGGTLDVENGVLVVDKATITFDGNSDENWTKSNSKWILSERYVYYPKAFPNGKPAGNDNNVNNLYMLSNMYNIQNTSYSEIIDKNNFMVGIGGSSTGCAIGVNTDISELTDFKTWLGTNNLQVVYPLATPTTISLTPEQVKLLQGVNNISTDGDKITLTYRDGSVATLGDLTSAVDELDGKIDESKILTDTATGDKYILVVTNGVLSVEQINN